LATAVSQSAFYQLPKPLFEQEQYQGLSIEAKLLYSAMRDRYRLSIINNWQDGAGYFIRMTRQFICNFLKRSEPTVRKIIGELIDIGLIFERRMGLTQSNKIYVQLLDGESISAFQSREKSGYQTGKKPGFTPDRKQLSPNNNKLNDNNPHKIKVLKERPVLPKLGDLWEENGILWTFARGFVQTYYPPEYWEGLGGVL